MIRTSYDPHLEFLEMELNKQTEDYIALVSKPALALMAKEEVITAQFLRFDEGVMIVRLKSSGALPSSNQHFVSVLLSDQARSFKNWGMISWSELRSKNQVAFSDAVCIWTARYDEGYHLAGFRGIEVVMGERLVKNCLVTFGPKEQPFGYLKNLGSIIKSSHKDSLLNFSTDRNISEQYSPISVKEKRDISGFMLSQLSLSDKIIIQGPPGTGKTHLIAHMVANLLTKGYSVIASSLTNRALIELASKDGLRSAMRMETSSNLRSRLMKG